MKYINNLELKWKLIAGFSVPLVLIFIISTTVYFSLERLLKTNFWVNHTYEAIDLGNKIGASLVDMETGLRGFLVSGKEEFLEPYHAGQKNFKELMAQTQKKVSDNPGQVARLKEVEQLESEWQTKHTLVAMDYRREVNVGQDAADYFKQVSARTVGKEKFDGFRAALGALEQSFIRSGDEEGLKFIKLILIDMINQETGQRGFLLTGKEESLEPYVAGISSFKVNIAGLKKHVGRNSGLQSTVAEIENMAIDWKEQAADPEIQARREMNKVTMTLSDITTFIEQGIGKAYMDNMRAVLKAFVDEEAALIVVRNDNQEFTSTLTKVITIVGALLAIAIGGWLTIVITKMVLRQLGADPVELRRVAERIADGDFSMNLSTANTSGVLQSMAQMKQNLEARQKLDTDFQGEIEQLVSTACRGDFSQSIATEGKTGVYLEVSSGLNQLVETCQLGLSDANRVLAAIAEGDLSKTIDADYQGAFLELKESTNNTVNKLNLTMGEISSLVSTANRGEFSAQIEMLGKQGFFAELSASLNLLMTTTNKGLNDVQQILSALAVGDLSKSIDDEYQGAFKRLKDDSNNTVNQIKNVMGDITGLVRSANQGDFTANIDLRGKEGFFAELSENLNTLTATTNRGLNDVQRILAALAKGDLSQSIDADYQGAFLELKDYSNNTVEKIQVVMAEISALVDSANNGDFKTEIEMAGKEGFFAELSQNLNLLVNTTDRGLEDVLRILAALAKGDLSQSIEADYKGAFKQLKDYSNNTVDQIESVMGEISELVEAANKGQFDTEINLTNKEGFFADLSANLNQLVGTTNRGLNDVLRILSALEKGDLSQSITADYEGTFKQLKDYSNNTINQMKQVMEDIGDLVASANEGHFNSEINLDEKAGFFKTLSANLNELMTTIDSGLVDVMAILAAMSEGNLTQKIERNYSGSFAKLSSDANSTVDKLTDIIGQIHNAANKVTAGSQEIELGNADLSQRTEQQASSLEETAASMEEMNATVKQNADSAKKARDLATAATSIAQKGGSVVSEAVAGMQDINAASEKISNIIGVIDEIAFQTNLLALNAAVEAARAGEQGKGFAVVAGEVRNLAQRSAEAAKEIKDLIRDSVSKIEDGTQLVNASGSTLNEIVASIQDVSQTISDIAVASEEQSDGVEQVNKAIASMDSMTQQNAALVEEATAAATSMAEQARAMTQLLSFFVINTKAFGNLPQPNIVNETKLLN